MRPRHIDMFHDGLTGQTASTSFHVERTAQFTQHLENAFFLPEDEDVWSTNCQHIQYALTVIAS